MLADPSPGLRIAGRYRLDARLGLGTPTSTWAATDLRSGRPVVVKLLLLAGLSDWKVVELFEREAQLLRDLDHPALPRYLDSFSERDPAGARLVLVQERVAGEDLASLLARGERFDEPRLIGVAIQLLELLVHLHGLAPPVVHRDLKPANVVLRPDGGLALVDFGCAGAALRATGAGGSTVVGTAGYMPPEQLLGRALPASDLYALGCTLVHLATGVHPAELPLRELRLDYRGMARLSPRLAALLDRLLEPDPARRLGDARAALAAFRALAQAADDSGTRRTRIDGPLKRWRGAASRVGADGLELRLSNRLSTLGGTGIFMLLVAAGLVLLAVYASRPGGILSSLLEVGSTLAISLQWLPQGLFELLGRTELRLDGEGLWIRRRLLFPGPARRVPLTSLGEPRVMFRPAMPVHRDTGEQVAHCVTIPAGTRDERLGIELPVSELAWLRDLLADHLARLSAAAGLTPPTDGAPPA